MALTSSVRESAVIFPLVNVDAAIGPWRIRHDPAAQAGVAAHITILYPFVPPDRIDEHDLSRLDEYFSRLRPFEVQLGRTARFPGVLYLVPEPEALLVRIIRDLSELFPQHPPYQGRYQNVIPHLTVAQVEEETVLDAVEVEVASVLPLASPVDRAWLTVEDESGRWSVVRSFHLGP